MIAQYDNEESVVNNFNDFNLYTMMSLNLFSRKPKFINISNACPKCTVLPTYN